MRPILLASVLAPLAACAVDPYSRHAGGFVLEPIGREVVFDAPLAARLYVDYRAVSYPGRVVEYGVQVDGRPFTVVYGIDAAAALPLQTRIYDPGDGVPLLTLLAGAHDLELYERDAAAPAVRVTAYTEPGHEDVAITGAMALEPALRPILDAVLPARPEIAPVPAFWQNIDQPAGGSDGIGHTSSSQRPVLADWSVDLSLLGALFLQAPCLADAVGYRCPCMRFSAPQVGAIDTCP